MESYSKENEHCTQISTSCLKIKGGREQVAPQAHGTQLFSFLLFPFLCLLLIARADCSPWEKILGGDRGSRGVGIRFSTEKTFFLKISKKPRHAGRARRLKVCFPLEILI